jgi:antitoxin component of RelBE/YafQ-DinJ toxin-antitoxin module
MSKEISISDPAEDGLGPAMLACTALERRYVVALCELGGQDHTRALEMAGSGASNKQTMRVMAHVMFHRQRVQDALKEEAVKRLNGYGLMAASNLVEMARSARDEKIKLKANLELLNRTGMSMVQKMEVRHVDVSKSDEELVRRMSELVRRNPDYLDMVPEPLRPAVMASLPPPTKQSAPSIIDVTVDHGEEATSLDPEIAEPEWVDPDADILGD